MTSPPSPPSPPPGPPPSPEVAASATGYGCPNCGADLAFDAIKGAMACAHCDQVVAIEAPTAVVVEHDFTQALADAGRKTPAEIMPGGVEVQCKTCGARSMVAKHATRCTFCDDPMVVAIPETTPMIAPGAMLPFAHDKAAADAAYRTWLTTRWFAPSDLKTRAARDGLDGVYVPYWTFDSHTTTTYQGQRGDHYYVSVSYRDAQGNQRTRQEQRTRWSSASGTVAVGFDDVLVPASDSLPTKLLERLEPWDLAAVVPFDGRYLAGFAAERYRIDLEPGFRAAEAKMEPQIRSAICRDIGGDVQRISRMHVHHDHTRFKHLLLPMWISSFRYKGRVFRVSVNARSAEVAGERPYSAVKITLAIVAALAVIIGIIVLIQTARGR